MIELFQHQKEAVNFAAALDGKAAIYHEMGLGKTRTAIEIFENFRKNRDSKLKLLVICPLSLLEGAWGQDIKKFSSYNYWNCHQNNFPENLDSIDILLINFEGLLSEKRYKILYKIILKNSWMVIIDESSRLKSHNSLTTKTILKMRNLFQYRLVMSGTPAPNSELEYWGQMEFIRPGIFDHSFYKFRNTFFHLGNRYTGRIQDNKFLTRSLAQELFKNGWQYQITQIKKELLIKRILPFCHWVKKKDALDLPEEMKELRFIQMGKIQSKIYHEMKTRLITEISGSDITAQVALTRILKLREITSGFAIDENQKACDIGESPKIKELLNIIEEAGKQPIIIWCHFHWEILKVCHELYKKYGENQIVTLYGGTVDRNKSILDFQSGGVRFLVAHPRSAGHGLTFINCSTQIFFSLDYSLENYEQSKARIHRAGQKNKCTYLHILAKDTIDEEIYSVLEKKKTSIDFLNNFLKK